MQRHVKDLFIIGCILCSFSLANRCDAAERTFKAGGKVVTPDRQAVAEANKFLLKIDTGNYRHSWEAFPSRIKRGGAGDEETWVRYLNVRRAPLGRAVSRELFRARFMNTLTGAPDGTYECLDYRTSFERKKQAFESMVLTKESGHWQVSGYRCW